MLNNQSRLILKKYNLYLEKSIKNRFFKHTDLLTILNKHTQNGFFKNEILGYSVENRSIHHLSIGTGKRKILLWSQMHGDEATATMALFDLFNFFSHNDEFNNFRKTILSKLSLHFIPMVNPDGAQQWKRRNTLNIDINRDAIALISPESKILKKIAFDLQPEFGFNLHDQSTLYSVGNTKEPTTIAFLAPPFNQERDENEIRNKSMQLIGKLFKNLTEIIPGKIAKFSDDFEKRAFGDNFQKWGISTILLESGGYPNDVEKQYIRKLNFYILLNSFEIIANSKIINESLETYYSIPFNTKNNFDLVIRSIQIEKNKVFYNTSLGINRTQIANSNANSFLYKSTIEEIGDMQSNFGYEEINVKNGIYTASKIKKMTIEEWNLLSQKEEMSLIKKGYLFVSLKNNSAKIEKKTNRLLNLVETSFSINNIPDISEKATFFIRKKNKLCWAINNGFIIDLNKKQVF